MNKKSFTLVEMLVVIAIISILAGLLVPAITRARDSAKGVTCINNFKQIAGAINSYQSDHKGFFPKNYGDQTYPRVSGALRLDYIDGVLDFYYLHSAVITKQVNLRTYNIEKDKGRAVWKCPKTFPLTETRPITGTRPLGLAWISIGNFIIDGKRYNHDFFGSLSGINMIPENGFGNSTSTIKMSAPPDELPIAEELCDAVKLHNNDPGNYNDVPPQHNGGFTVVWLDGHVSSEHPPKDVQVDSKGRQMSKKLNPNPRGMNDKWVAR